MFPLITNTYKSYHNERTGRRERHGWRLIVFVVAALAMAVLTAPSAAAIYSMMVTGLTILTGFTFTALFSDHSLADVGLPKPKNETDRYDIKILKQLADNFHVRARYFIVLSIIDVCILILLAADLSVPALLKDVVKAAAARADIDFRFLAQVFTVVANWTSSFLSFVTIFVFLECLYTFYRLAETIMAMVNRRRDYLRG